MSFPRRRSLAAKRRDSWRRRARTPRLEALENRYLLTLGPFNILAPDGVIQDTTPEIAWASSDGAAAYDVTVSDEAGVVRAFSDLTETSVTLTDPLADGTYSIDVTALGPNAAPTVDPPADATIDEGRFVAGFGHFTDPDPTREADNNGLAFSVQVDTTAPGPFDILAPDGPTHDQTPTAQWAAADGADFYDLTLATDAAGTEVEQAYSDLTATSQSFATLAEGTYYGFVTARDLAGNTTDASNNGLPFYVDITPPAAFSIQGPTGTIDDPTPVIAWDAAIGATGYDVIVSTEPDGSTPVHEVQDLTGTSYTVPTALEDGSYYTLVTAADAAGNLTPATNTGLAFSVATPPEVIHKVFATSGLKGLTTSPQVPPPDLSSFGSMDAAGYLCTFAAYRGGMLPNWNGVDVVYQAILSTENNNAKDRLTISGPIYNMKGDLIALDSADLWDANIENIINYDEFGNLIDTNISVWSGTTGTGTWSGLSCGDWNVSASTTAGTIGDIFITNSAWINAGSIGCNNSARLYCISPAIAPLLITGEPGPGAPAGTELTEAALEPALETAVAYWASTDLSALPSELVLGIDELGPTELSNSYVGLSQIILDRDAAGYGWATDGSADRMDLLSAMVHEVGHVLGLQHADAATYDVMDAGLDAGERPTSLADWQDQAPSAWSGEVNYGDGSGWQPLTLNPDQRFGLAHHYPDSGTYTVTVRVTDEAGAVGEETMTVTVANIAPAVVLDVPETVLDEGDTLSGSGQFSDPGADTWTATVDYGDGSGPQPLALEADHSFSLSHTYAQDGQYEVVVSVHDDDGGIGSLARTVTVRNVIPTLTGVDPPATIEEGESVTLTGSFADPGVEDAHTVTVDWGDGTSGPATVDASTRTFAATHMYADDPAGTPDAYPVRVRVQDTDTVTPTGFIELDGHAYGLNDRAVCWLGTEADAQSLGGHLVAINSATEQSFIEQHFAGPHWIGLTDAGTEGTFQWTSGEPLEYTHWASGEPSGGTDEHYVAMGSDGQWRDETIWGPAEGYPGVVEVPVADLQDLTVTVNNAPPIVEAGADRALDEGQLLELTSASFTDAGSADSHEAVIDWGDGTVETAAVDATTQRVSGSHAYADDGNYTVTVTVQDNDDGVGSDTFVATVNNVAPTIALSGAASVDEGSAYALTLGPVTDPGEDAVQAYIVHWGDGHSDTYAAAGEVTHTYADGPASPAIVVDLVDEDGTHGSAGTLDLTVTNAPPTVLPNKDTVTVDEASPASNTGTHGDVGDDTVSLSASVGAITENTDGTWSWSYTPADGPDESQTVTITATDSDGAASTTTFDLTVVNVAPSVTANATAVTVDEGVQATNTGTFSDPGVDTVALAASAGTVTDNGDGTWSWSYDSTDGPDESQTVTITATDSDGAASTTTFDLTVVNVAPLVADATYAIVEHSDTGTVVGTLTATDPGDDVLTYSIDNQTVAGAFGVDSNTGEIAVADSALVDYEGESTHVLEMTVTDDDGATGTATVTVNLENLPSVTGTVFVDVNENGLYEANEMGIDGVLIELLDESGNAILDELGAATATTANGGYYQFEDLDPGTYQVREIQPTGVDDGPELLGSLGGTIPANDTFQMTLQNTDALDYVFAEIGQEVSSGDTAGIGFWQNRHGQELIKQGGAGLADWLTTNFSNVFGNTFTGEDATGDAVAHFYRKELFRQKAHRVSGPAKVDCQFMATALATYFTKDGLAGTVAADYGFNVTDTGIGTNVMNVGDNGAAFGVDDDTPLTIMDLLQATDLLTDIPDAIDGAAYIYDQDGDGEIDDQEAALRTMANEVYTAINEGGGK